MLVQRDVQIEPKRVISIFRERVEKHKDELAELQEQEKLIEKEKPVCNSFKCKCNQNLINRKLITPSKCYSLTGINLQ